MLLPLGRFQGLAANRATSSSRLQASHGLRPRSDASGTGMWRRVVTCPAPASGQERSASWSPKQSFKCLLNSEAGQTVYGLGSPKAGLPPGSTNEPPSPCNNALQAVRKLVISPAHTCRRVAIYAVQANKLWVYTDFVQEARDAGYLKRYTSIGIFPLVLPS